MITLTPEVKAKLVEKTNKERHDHISNVKLYEPFLYIGVFNTLEPEQKKIFRKENGEIMIHVCQKPICNQAYAAILEKREDYKIYDVETGVCVNIAPASFSLPLGNAQRIDLTTEEDDLVYADINIVSKITDNIKAVFDELQQAEIESRTLKRLSENLKQNFVSRLTELMKNFFDGTDLEYKYLVRGAKKFPLYERTPKIGECFGYVGPIRILCAKRVKLIDNGHDARFGFYPEIMQEKLQYPLFFYRISEDKAVEVTSGITFQFQGNYQDDARYEDLKDAPLLIGDYDLLLPSDEFKLEYANEISQKRKFIEWIEAIYKIFREAFEREIYCALEKFYFKPEDAKLLAGVDNDVFDLEHKKKLELQQNQSSKAE